MTNSPAVSVIIPMYNAENFIAECLESIFMQTFQDYEVIVVDDCSTDNSCAVVESYAEKFGGRLKLIHTEKNSGYPATPRNKGLMLSRGEYVFFIDNDDLIIDTTLEEMYTAGKNYNADVVYCEKNYIVNNSLEELQVEFDLSGEISPIPTFEPENLAERIQDIFQDKFFVPPWRKLVKRDLLIENEIFFPHVTIAEDDIWTYGLIFYAKKFLRLPSALYIRRLSENAVTRRQRTVQQAINFNINPIIIGLKTIDNLMEKLVFFKENVEYRYAIFEYFIDKMYNFFPIGSFQVPSSSIYQGIKEEFGKELGNNDVLVSALCTFINTQQKILAIRQQEFNQFATQAQNRIKELEEQLKTI